MDMAGLIELTAEQEVEATMIRGRVAELVSLISDDLFEKVKSTAAGSVEAALVLVNQELQGTQVTLEELQLALAFNSLKDIEAAQELSSLKVLSVLGGKGKRLGGSAPDRTVVLFSWNFGGRDSLTCDY
jgi:hypothetical protein